MTILAAISVAAVSGVPDVFAVNLDVVVAIRSLVLVVESQSCTELALDCRFVIAALTVA